MSIIKYNPSDVIFDKKEILPCGKLGSFVDRHKVFEEETGISYPRPINWNTCLNEQGDFDVDAFFSSRHRYTDQRKQFMEKIQYAMLLLEKRSQSDPTDLIDLSEFMRDIMKGLEKMAFPSDENYGVYNQDFYLYIDSITKEITEQAGLEDGVFDIKTHFPKIKEYVAKGLAREAKGRDAFLVKSRKLNTGAVNEYIKEDGSLDVDVILTEINSGSSWNEEHMLAAFYMATCDSTERTRLQVGVIKALEDKMRKLDTCKVFIIIERILPFINHQFKIDWDLPEIFRPEYLSHIHIHCLDIDQFITQVKSEGAKHKWTEEIQNKLGSRLDVF